MKYGFILFFIITTFLFGCTKQVDDFSLNSSNDNNVQLESQMKFAKILSLAVHDNKDLRNFLKSQAIYQFDNDNDILYQLAKDKIVSGIKSFKEILIQYSDEETMDQIEKNDPLLNILVPNISFTCGFNAKSWDTEKPDIAVTVLTEDDMKVYDNGKISKALKSNEIPCFPVLLIKNNERVRVDRTATKGGEPSVVFLDKVYDGDNKDVFTKGRRVDTDYIYYDTDPATDWISADLLDSRLIQSWNLLGRNDSIPQRDNIYYGITPIHKGGKLNNNIFETLLRFKLNDIASSDQFTGSENKEQLDPKFITRITQAKHHISDEELYKKIWTEGKFELEFDFVLGVKGESKVITIQKKYSVDPYDLFDLSKIQCDFKHHTVTQHALYTYIMNASDLVPKWYYPEQHASDIKLYVWDVAQRPQELFYYVIERDDDQTSTHTETITQEHSTTFTQTTKDGKTEVSMSHTDKYSQSYTATITTTTGKDNLGQSIILYQYPIISGASLKNGVSGYNLVSYGTGSVDVTLVPRYILN